MLLLALLALWSVAPPDDVSGRSCSDVDLIASKTYNPPTWSDGVATLAAPLTFEIPASLPVTSGNAGNHTATLTFSLGGGAPVECIYRGGSSQAHPVGQPEIDLGLTYLLSSCDDGSAAGELATADHLELHVADGDSYLPETVVEITLEDAGCLLDDGPCAGDTWGGITWLSNTVHVRADGDDLGDGSIGAPVATMARAHGLLRGLTGRKAIAVGPGTFDAALLLDDGLLDDDAWVMGCSPAETVLVGADPAAPVVDLAAPALQGVRSLTVQGGGAGVAIRDGATGFVDDVAAVNTGGPGVRVDDAATFATLLDLEVTDPLGGACGWGVAIADGTALMQGVAITGAEAVGLGVLDGTAVGFRNRFSSTQPDALGMLGRGVHTEDAWTILLGAHLVDNFDAGVFLKDPRGAVISQILIDFTSAGITANGGTTGDGIVVSGNGNNAQVMVIDNVVYRADRKAMVVDDADAWVGSNISGSSGVKQGVTALAGPQASLFVDSTAAPLDLNRDPQRCP